ncbi:ABC transporter permease [Paraburkholderia silvatlantica]|uniref:ABC transporter permease n=1 Tax=Paraburkholderia silvatlantica TaxID=321895 RepID=UPI00105D59C3|nr:ABC transporter permease [Paraburkholderia silvatlantica]TDQ81115.1 ribose transport system permease protein [Paraburkholderia silvatlantica]
MTTNSTNVTMASPRSDARRASRINPDYLSAGLLFALTVLMIACSRLISPSLGSWAQVSTVLTLGCFLLVAAFGQGLVILSGGLDLSVASLFMFGGVMSTALIGSSNAGAWYLMPAILVGAGLIGALSGVGIAWLKIPPFIMTMGVGIIVGSIALGYTSGSTLGGSPLFLEALMKGSLLNVPVVVLVFVAICVVGLMLQTRTVFGRNLYAIGGSLGAARVSGIPVTRTLVLTYTGSAICAAAGGALLTGYSGGATLMMGEPYLLPSIAAVVVGGSSILGGRGSFLGTIVGTLFLTTLDSVIAATGLAQGWRLIVSGLVIVVALLCQSSSAGSLATWFSRLRR